MELFELLLVLNLTAMILQSTASALKNIFEVVMKFVDFKLDEKEL